MLNIIDISEKKNVVLDFFKSHRFGIQNEFFDIYSTQEKIKCLILKSLFPQLNRYFEKKMLFSYILFENPFFEYKLGEFLKLASFFRSRVFYDKFAGDTFFNTLDSSLIRCLVNVVTKRFKLDCLESKPEMFMVLIDSVFLLTDKKTQSLHADFESDVMLKIFNQLKSYLKNHVNKVDPTCTVLNETNITCLENVFSKVSSNYNCLKHEFRLKFEEARCKFRTIKYLHRNRHAIGKSLEEKYQVIRHNYDEQASILNEDSRRTKYLEFFLRSLKKMFDEYIKIFERQTRKKNLLECVVCNNYMSNEICSFIYNCERCNQVKVLCQNCAVKLKQQQQKCIYCNFYEFTIYDSSNVSEIEHV